MVSKMVARQLITLCENFPRGHQEITVKTDKGSVKLYWALAHLMVWTGDNAQIATVDNVAHALKHIGAC